MLGNIGAAETAEASTMAANAGAVNNFMMDKDSFNGLYLFSAWKKSRPKRLSESEVGMSVGGRRNERRASTALWKMEGR